MAIIAAVALVIGACAGTDEGEVSTTTAGPDGTTSDTAAPGPSDEPVELTIWFTQEEGTPSFDPFMAKYPNITVNID
ncbi:MAG: hypothetical protein ACRDZM_09485, partial [Acidimicrobiia bacterium]